MVRIKQIFILGFCLLAGAASAGDLTHWVDPFIGTGKKGNTFPGAVVPWGMVSVSPHNDLQAPSGYKYGRPFIYGFGQVHLSGTDCPDLGNVLIMPSTGPIAPQPENWRSEYDSEAADPGYYRVRLKTSDVEAEMTASSRVGVSRYSFPVQKGDANILIDVSRRLNGDPVTAVSSFESHVKIVSDTEMEGFSQSGNFCSSYAGNKQTVYFVARFSKPASSMGTWKNGKLEDGTEQSGRSIGAFFRYSTAQSESIVVKVGISYVSVENARLNLEAEVKGWDFDAVRVLAKKAWGQELSKVKATSASGEKLRIFYTALYHALIHPNVFNDVNGEYQGMGRSGVKTAMNYTRYSVFQLWNTYRNLHPFLSLIYPERELDMVKSLTEMSKEGGWLPRWELAGNDTQVMVADPAVPVILDSYMQGVRSFDVDSAYDAIVKSLDPDGNQIFGGLRSLLKYGYIPKNDDSHDRIWGSVSTSLEYAYDFWCLAQLAKELKKDQDYKKYIHLSGLYHNLYDPASGFLRPKKRDGSWMTPFDPLTSCCDQGWANSGGPGYVEGTAWQYLFFTPQDIDGLKMLLGGDELFTDRLQECFDGGHYDPGNEPDLAWPYLFDYVPSQAWRAQKEVRGIMARSYGMGPDGLPGNDDGGTLSAWYLFSALGFYPVCPGSNTYQLGSPIFKQVDIHTHKSFYPGGLLTLKSIDNSDRNVYVRSVLVNGIPYQKTYLNHDALVTGGTIVFKMDSQPKK